MFDPCEPVSSAQPVASHWHSKWAFGHWRFFSLGVAVLLTGATLLNAVAQETKKPTEPVAAAKPTEWKPLFDGKTLKNWTSTEFGGQGEVEVKDGVIVMQQGSEMTGITWKGGDLPKMNYELSLNAKKIDGSDFFCGLTFQVGEQPCSFIIGGWGGGVVGISSLDGLDAANNETAQYRFFEQNKWYKVRLRVTDKGLTGWIDDEQVVGVETKGRKISIRHEVELSRPLGISCYSTVSGLKDIKVRELTKEEAAAPITPPPPPKEDKPKKSKSEPKSEGKD